MKVKEMKKIVEKIYKELSWSEDGEYMCVGLRFEDKDREVGETCENSRNNINREDEREFPEYGTDEYFQLEEMDGVSTWDLSSMNTINSWLWSNPEANATTQFIGNHAYIIVGDSTGWEQNNGLIDDGELLIKNGKVAYKIY